MVVLTGGSVGSTVQPGFLDGYEALEAGLGGDDGDLGGFQLASGASPADQTELGVGRRVRAIRWAKSASTAAMAAWWRGPWRYGLSSPMR